MSGTASTTVALARPDIAGITTRRRARICFPFSGDVIGGSHLSVLELVRRLDRERYDPLVVVQYPAGKLAQLFGAQGIRVLCPFDWPELPYATRVGANVIRAGIASLRQQIRFLRREAVDIVHINDGRTQVNWALATKLAGARLLWHHRGDPGSRGLRFAAPFLADRVLTVSQFSLPRPGMISAAGKASVVHSPFDSDLAVDRTAARAGLIAELGVPEETLLLGYFGAFVARKRPLLFIDMIARLRKLWPDRAVVGLMFGAAEEPPMDLAVRQRIAVAGLDEDVRVMGWRSPGPRWIAACDQLIVPAVGEPFGRTLIEAMLVGTPVVATRSGGNVEALDDGRLGRLVMPEDAEALARAAIALADDDPRALAATAQADARTRFGIGRHCRQVSAVYDALLA
ncbi:glycosyltransferase [Sphingomonas koreensis]|nr:glycosyltransferase [Sphingomonas koreensis]